MVNKEFKKGDKVYVHARDSRERDEEMIVVSAGKKWITCNPLKGDGTPWEYGGIQFDAETLNEKNYSRHELYHSKEEYEEKLRTSALQSDLCRALEYGKYSLEELLLFREIHETGVEKWKEQHYRE